MEPQFHKQKSHQATTTADNAKVLQRFN